MNMRSKETLVQVREAIIRLKNQRETDNKNQQSGTFLNRMNALVSSATPKCLKYHRNISLVLNSFTTTYSTNARTLSGRHKLHKQPKCFSHQRKRIFFNCQSVTWSQHNTAYFLVTEVEAEQRGRQTSSNWRWIQ